LSIRSALFRFQLPTEPPPNNKGSFVIFSTDIELIARSESEDIASLRNVYVLTPILLLQLFLAFYRIDYQSFWTDEVASLLAAAPGEPFFSSKIWLNGQGPLYFALLHIWLSIGDSEFVARSLAGILGAAAVCLTYALGLRLGNRKFATISAVLMATSPFLVWYSQETRYITLAIATSLLSMYSFHRAVVTNSFSAWTLYALATTTALFSFVPLAFLSVAQGLYLVPKERRHKLIKWISWQAGVSMIFGVWLLISYGGLSIDWTAGGDSLPIIVNPIPLETGTPKETTFGAIPYTFFAFSSGFSIGPSVEELHISRDLATLGKHLPILAPLTLLYGSLFIFGVRQLWRYTQNPGIVLLWLAIPILGVLTVSSRTDVAYNVRYACAALPAYIFILAAGINNIHGRILQLGILLAVLSINGVSLAQHYFNPQYAKADARGAARYLESMGHPGDVILLVGNSGALAHYYKGDLPVVHWSLTENSSRETVRSNVKKLIHRYGRLWLVAIRPWETDPKGTVKTVLDETLQNTDKLALPGTAISFYRHEKSTYETPVQVQ
jgi:mannosyltransferase